MAVLQPISYTRGGGSNSVGAFVIDPLSQDFIQGYQDSLDRIQKQEAIDAEAKKQKAAQAKQLIGDLNYEKGYFEGDEPLIRDAYKKAIEAKTSAYSLVSQNPNSDAAIDVLNKAKQAEANYLGIYNSSVNYAKRVDDLYKQIETNKDIDEDETLALIKSARNTPYVNRTQEFMAQLYAPKKVLSVSDVVAKDMEGLKKAGSLDDVQTGAPTVENVSGIGKMQVNKTQNISDDELFQLSRTKVNLQNNDASSKAVKKELMNYVSDPIQYAQLQQDAKDNGFDPFDLNELGSYLYYKNAKTYQQVKKSYSEIKLSDAQKEELKLQNKKRFYTWKEQQDGEKQQEKDLGLYHLLVQTKQGAPDALQGVSVIDPITNKQTFYAGRNLNLVTDKFTPLTKEGDEIVEKLDNNGKPVLVDNVIQKFIIDKDRKTYIVTTQSLNDYQVGRRKSYVIPATPEDVFGMYSTGQYGKSTKQREAALGSLKTYTDRYRDKKGFIIYDKMITPNVQNVIKYVENPSIPIEQGVQKKAEKKGVATVQKPKEEPSKVEAKLTYVFTGKDGVKKKISITKEQESDFLRQYKDAKRVE